MPAQSWRSPVSEPVVRRIHASDADSVRAIRLEALQDPAAGVAFLETYEHGAARPASFWTDRAVNGALSDHVGQFIAEADGRWVGTVTVLVPMAGTLDYFGRPHVDGRAQLVSVYVSSAHRGRGLLADLVERAAEWARAQGCADLVLDVHADNPRAQGAYRRLGFVATGETTQSANGTELAMVRSLVDA